MPNIKRPLSKFEENYCSTNKAEKHVIKVPKSDSGTNMNNERMEVVWGN